MKRFLRINDVVKMTGLGKSTIWAWVKEDRFPKPIKISPKITVWEEEAIIEWMNEMKNKN